MAPRADRARQVKPPLDLPALHVVRRQQAGREALGIEQRCDEALALAGDLALDQPRLPPGPRADPQPLPLPRTLPQILPIVLTQSRRSA